MGRLSAEVNAPPVVTGLLLIDTLLNRNLSAFLSTLHQLVLPAVTLAFFNLAIIVRTLKADIIDMLKEDFIQTARAMGLSQKRILFKHALRNALLPTVTMLGTIYGFLLGGAVLTEVVFSWPGVGMYAVESIKWLDYAGLQGFIIFYVLIFTMVNLLVDISYRGHRSEGTTGLMGNTQTIDTGVAPLQISSLHQEQACPGGAHLSSLRLWSGHLRTRPSLPMTLWALIFLSN